MTKKWATTVQSITLLVSFFFSATTLVAECGFGDEVPIQTLKLVFPLALEWWQYVRRFPFGIIITIAKSENLSLSGIVNISSEGEGRDRAGKLASEVRAWMERHHFKDAWIGDRAINALIFYALQRNPVWDERGWPRLGALERDRTLYPRFELRPIDWRLTHGLTLETPDQFLARLGRDVEAQLIKFRKRVKILHGVHVDHRRSAFYAAARIAGGRYADLARRLQEEGVRTACEDNIRQSTYDYADRVGLTLPGRQRRRD